LEWSKEGVKNLSIHAKSSLCLPCRSGLQTNLVIMAVHDRVEQGTSKRKSKRALVGQFPEVRAEIVSSNPGTSKENNTVLMEGKLSKETRSRLVVL